MMRGLVAASLRAKRGVIAAAAVIFAFGVWQVRQADLNSLPEFTPTVVEVQTEALGLSAEEMEQLITVPLEQDLLNGVAWMESIRSQSVPGLSSIVMQFEPGTDLYRARQVVQERLNEAHALPNVAKVPAMLQPQSSTSRAMMISLSSKELSPIELGVLARWTVVPRLTGVPGVSNVVIWGQKERQLQVLVDPARLAAAGVTLDQVISTTGNALWASPLTFLEASTPGTGGFIDQNNQRLGVQHLSPIKTADELARVAIEDSESSTGAAPGAPLRLGDVADVVEDHQALIGDAVVDGGEGLILVVEKLPDTSTTAVTEGIEDAIDAMRPGLTGVEIDTGIYRPATYLEKAGDNLARSVVIGAVLLVLALFAFLLSWRRALISVVAIAFALLAAVLVLYVRESTFNAVVIAGLVMALAAVVDDATSAVDRAARRLRAQAHDGAGDGQPGASSVILAASMETARTLGFALAALVVALVPVFVLEGLAGDSFYPPLAVSFLIAVVVSFLVAMTLTPALALVLLPRSAGRDVDSPVLRGVRRGYGKVLQPMGRTPIPALLVGAAVILVGVASFLALDRSVLPPLKETDLLIAWNGPPGASLPEMDRITTRAADELRGLEGVRNVDAHVGRAVRGDLVGGANTGEIWVSLDPGAPYRSTIRAMEDVVDGYPGLDRKVLTYSQNRISEVLASERTPIRVRLYGQDLNVLQEKAAEVGQLLSGVDGARDVRVQRIVTEPTIEIEVDLPKAQAAGIKPGDVRRAATTLVSGIQVGALFEEQKIFEVQVWGRPEVRRSVSDVENLLLDLPDGGHVTLGEVADVRIGSSPTSIDHDATSRSLDVTAAVSGRSRAAVVNDLQERMGEVSLPLEYHAEVLGGYQDRTAAERKLAAFLLGAAVGIFLLLQAAFSSWRLAVVAFAGLVVAVSGAFVAAWVDGGHLSLATVAGALAVLALAVRQVLDLFGRAQQLERDEGQRLGRDLVERVATERCGPVVTTMGVTALAVLPIVVAGTIAGQEIVKPLSVAVLGGLMTCTIAVLFVLPPLYLRFAPRRTDRDAGLAADDTLPAEPPVLETMATTTHRWPAPPAATTPEG
jgi:Cu/Ag efflux pump CusA